MLLFIIGMMLGTFAGIVLQSMVIIAKEADEEIK